MWSRSRVRRPHGQRAMQEVIEMNRLAAAVGVALCLSPTWLHAQSTQLTVKTASATVHKAPTTASPVTRSGASRSRARGDARARRLGEGGVAGCGGWRCLREGQHGVARAWSDTGHRHTGWRHLVTGARSVCVADRHRRACRSGCVHARGCAAGYARTSRR